MKILKENEQILHKCANLLLEKEKIGRDEFEALFEASGSSETAVEGIDWGE